MVDRARARSRRAVWRIAAFAIHVDAAATDLVRREQRDIDVAREFDDAVHARCREVIADRERVPDGNALAQRETVNVRLELGTRRVLIDRDDAMARLGERRERLVIAIEGGGVGVGWKEVIDEYAAWVGIFDELFVETVFGGAYKIVSGDVVEFIVGEDERA